MKWTWLPEPTRAYESGVELTAGTLVWAQEGEYHDEPKLLLIGEVNTSQGECGCCQAGLIIHAYSRDIEETLAKVEAPKR